MAQIVMDWTGVFVLILIDIKLWPQIFHVPGEPGGEDAARMSGCVFFNSLNRWRNEGRAMELRKRRVLV